MREVKLLLVAVLLLSVAAFAQLPNTAQAPPADPNQASAPGQPAVASPAVTPEIKANPGVTRPQSDTAAPQKNAIPSPALPASQRVKRIAMMDIAGEPGFNGIAFTGGFLVISHSANDSVDVFNVRQRRLIKQIPGMEGATGIAIDSKGETVYVANRRGNNIAVISTKDWQVTRTIKLEHAPNGLLLADENLLYSASSRDQTVSLIDPLQGKVISTVEVNGSPEHLAYDSQRRELFATLEAQNEVAVLDPSLKVLRRFKLAASQPTGILFDGKANRLYVAVRYAVLALDPQSGKELGRIAAPAGVDSLVLNPADGSLYTGSEGGTVQLIRAGGGQFAVEQEVATEVRGHDVAIDPQTQMIFMPGGRDGRAKLLLLKRVDSGPPTLSQTAAQQN